MGYKSNISDKMNTVLVLFSILTISQGLVVDIFYESLCPDSTRFISQQIPPMYEAIGQHVEIRFRPYGFATTTEVDGSYQFECQHGERECYGNIVQACTVHYTSDQTAFKSLVWTTSLSRTVLRVVKVL